MLLFNCRFVFVFKIKKGTPQDWSFSHRRRESRNLCLLLDRNVESLLFSAAAAILPKSHGISGIVYCHYYSPLDRYVFPPPPRNIAICREFTFTT